MNPTELSRQIFACKKNGEHREALELFERHAAEFPPEELGRNPYLVAAMATVYRKLGMIAEAFHLFERLGVKIGEGTEPMVANAYGWVVYDWYKNAYRTPGFDHRLFYLRWKAVMAALPGPWDSYSATLAGLTLRTVLKHEKERASVNYRFLDAFLVLFDPECLDDTPHRFTIRAGGREKEVVSASDRESWYAARTKALLALGRYEETVTFCEKALSEVPELHHNNESWFTRRIALACRGLGELDRAVASLEKLLEKKNEWFIRRELAEIHMERGETGKALALACEAMVMPGKVEYKVGAIELIGDLVADSDEETARAHYTLACAIRSEHMWKISPKLQPYLEDAFTTSRFIMEPRTEELLERLRGFWKEKAPKPRQAPKKRGVVTKILHDNERGVDGFIRSDGEEVYFSLPAHAARKLMLGEGDTVAFEIRKSPRGMRAEKLRTAQKV